MPEKEYIEREKLNDMLEDFCVNESFYDALQTIPAADVAPVRHGRWIEQCEESFYSCSACGTEWITIEGTPEENGMDFCPHCGARMDEKERDENG